MGQHLKVRNLTAFYHDFQALYGIDLNIEKGSTVAIIGANGAGKSTFINSLAGHIDRPAHSIVFNGENISKLSAPDIFKKGIAVVPEGRRLFPSLTVKDNLLIGQDGRGLLPETSVFWTLDRIYDLFPVLKEKSHSAIHLLSGGQQQMVAIGRALMSNPELLICDELSLGLAPIVIKDIYATLPHIKQQGTSLIIVEQDIVQALAVADEVYCFQEGRMTLKGTPDQLSIEEIHNAYFGS